jgi:ABC-2 type transport system permease protein
VKARADGEAGAARAGRALVHEREALRALAELRLRLLLRRLRGRGGIPELVARLVMFVVAIPAGLAFAVLAGLGSWQAVRAGEGLRAVVPAMALFFGVWQTWTAVALSLSDRDALDLSRFLVYPLPPSRVFGYGLVTSVLADPFALFWCLLLAGAYAGAAIARPGAWLVLLAAVYVGFVVATAALVALLQELLARLMRGGRARELAIAAVYVGTAFLVAWGGSGGTRSALAGLHALGAIRWIAFPPALAAEAARNLYGGRALAALPWLGALGLAAALAAWAAYRLALADARSGGEGSRATGASATEGWRVPGRLGPLVEKEAKYLLRHPLSSILALVVPALAGFVAWKAAPRIPVEAGEVVRALPLLGFALYAHLATQVFWLNAFGWDRGGARLYFLAPVDPADAIRAKNTATYALSLALFVACAAALAAVGGAPPAWALAGALALHAGIAPWFLAAGNVVSILNPRAASHGLQRGGRLSPLSVLAGMAIVSSGSGLFAAPVLLAIRRDQPWLLVSSWLALGAIGAALYRAVLPRLGRLLTARREPLLDAVAGDED